MGAATPSLDRETGGADMTKATRRQRLVSGSMATTLGRVTNASKTSRCSLAVLRIARGAFPRACNCAFLALRAAPSLELATAPSSHCAPRLPSRCPSSQWRVRPPLHSPARCASFVGPQSVCNCCSDVTSRNGHARRRQARSLSVLANSKPPRCTPPPIVPRLSTLQRRHDNETDSV